MSRLLNKTFNTCSVPIYIRHSSIIIIKLSCVWDISIDQILENEKVCPLGPVITCLSIIAMYSLKCGVGDIVKIFDQTGL